MVISLWQRCSPEDTAPNSLGDAEAKGEIQGAMATHTMLGTLKKQERTLCHGQLCHGHVQPQSKVHARLEVGCSYPKHPTKGKRKAQGSERGTQKGYLQISGASSEPSGQSLSPSHRQPFEMQVIWSLQANCLGLHVLGAKGKERKGKGNSWTLGVPRALPSPVSILRTVHLQQRRRLQEGLIAPFQVF